MLIGYEPPFDELDEATIEEQKERQIVETAKLLGKMSKAIRHREAEEKQEVNRMKEYIKEMAEFKSNQSWFMKNFDNILKKYRDMFVAVWRQSVLDADMDLKSLQKRVCEKTKRAGSVYVEYVTDEPLELVL